jgi:hypothetical protein
VPASLRALRWPIDEFVWPRVCTRRPPGLCFTAKTLSTLMHHSFPVLPPGGKEGRMGHSFPVLPPEGLGRDGGQDHSSSIFPPWGGGQHRLVFLFYLFCMTYTVDFLFCRQSSQFHDFPLLYRRKLAFELLPQPTFKKLCCTSHFSTKVASISACLIMYNQHEHPEVDTKAAPFFEVYKQ